MVNGESCKAFVVNRQSIIVNGLLAENTEIAGLLIVFYINISQQLNHITIHQFPFCIPCSLFDILYASTSFTLPVLFNTPQCCSSPLIALLNERNSTMIISQR